MQKKLSDITNTHSQSIIAEHDEDKRLHKPPFAEIHVHQLLKEKDALLKLLEERNKIIQLSGEELQNLRLNYQKLQMQNWNLAQSNTQILAELNMAREKFKAIQHDLLCKESLLKVIQHELICKELLLQAKEPERKKSCTQHQPTTPQEESKIKPEFQPKASNIRPSGLKRPVMRNQSVGPCAVRDVKFGRSVNDENKRRVRRKTMEFMSSKPMDKEHHRPPLFYIQDEEETAHRSSIGRPSRRAAEKVQSYREIPLNVKMRRD